MKTKPLALIVDDNLRVREAVEDRVAELDHDFHSVGSQREACEHLDLHTYDYILLDLELPARSGKPPRAEVGRELLRQIKEDPRNHAAPVLSMSAHFGPDSELGVEMVERMDRQAF
ncbi:MAG: response regulator [Verrucomicrobiaceae bacterium]|nr:response regulator [Verrucomicrobiaceae bacterium]